MDKLNKRQNPDGTLIVAKPAGSCRLQQSAIPALRLRADFRSAPGPA